jgi:YVTN family beta-propeller protein
VRALIGGKATCLRAGARCKKRYESIYRRHGFHCANGRLAKVRTGLRVAGKIVGTTHLDDTVVALAAGEGAVWASKDDAAGVARIDPATNQVAGTTIPTHPEDSPPLVAAGNGGVWVSNFSENTVTRADPSTAAVAATIHVGLAPEGIAFTPGAVWVANHHGSPTGSLSRIDPATNAVVATVPAGKAQDCCGPQGLAATDNAVWTDVPNLNAVVRVDPASNSVAATIADPPACGGVAAATDAVWVAAGCGLATVTRIDPATNRVVSSVSVAGVAQDVALGFGSVWVLTSYTLDRIDPQTNKVVARLRLAAPVGAGAPSFPVGGIAIGNDSIWVGRGFDVLRIQPS